MKASRISLWFRVLAAYNIATKILKHEGRCDATAEKQINILIETTKISNDLVKLAGSSLIKKNEQLLGCSFIPFGRDILIGVGFFRDWMMALSSLSGFSQSTKNQGKLD